MTTYPNQKIIHIQKKKVVKDFLQIGNSEWKKAYKDLKASTFGLYLYLASNADGYDLALSQKAIEEDIGISESSYKRAVKELKEKNYLVEKQGNVFYFFTTPCQIDTMGVQIDTTLKEEKIAGCQNDTTKGFKMTPSGGSNWTDDGVKMIPEIDKHIITDKIDKGSTPLTRSEPVRPQAGEPKGKGMEGTRADTIEKLLEDREVYLLTSKSGEAHEYTFKDFYEEVAGSSENLENIIDAWKRGIERTQENKRKF